ncbi:hypothetical protein CYY_010219 [Polysphondylium violaceum]|uniref:LPG0439 HIT-related domain-containing protein n=1 Tax=Polysphondylium violaceum TaxID=133409 RepID=A0A8J4PJW0_9MYCE|nr:hypothetical protein CYY_010219 [Polysphondylium violaceum]
MSLHFSKLNIPLDHWSINTNYEYFIKKVKVDEQHFVSIKLNPTDRRGYRLIIQYDVDNDSDIKSTFNRVWTSDEMNAVFKVATTLSGLFFNLNLFPQIIFAANNSMDIIKSTETSDCSEDKIEYDVRVGYREPCILHVHILGRGISNHEYVKGIPLDAPEIGQEFNLKGNGDQFENKKKLEWTQAQRDSFKSIVLDFLQLKFPL